MDELRIMQKSISDECEIVRAAIKDGNLGTGAVEEMRKVAQKQVKEHLASINFSGV